MKLTLVDTSHWVGAFSRRDDYKEEGKKFLEWFDQQDEKKSINKIVEILINISMPSL